MNKQFAKRLLFMSIGVFFQGISVGLLVCADMGNDPFTTACLAFAAKTGWLLGSAELLVSGFMLLLVLWRDKTRIGIGTLANMIGVGYIADFTRWILRKVAVPMPQTLLERTLWMIPALAIFVVAAALYMTAELGTAPYDAMAFVLARLLPQFSFRVVRMAWDFLWIILTLVLGGSIGPVTVAIMLTMGPTVSLIGKVTTKYLYQETA